MSLAGFLKVLSTSVKPTLTSTSSKKTLKSLVIVLILFALEQILTTKNLYSCPSTNYYLYGGLFLFGPSLCLFVLALFMNESLWDSVTGCYRGNFHRPYVYRKVFKAFGTSAFIALVWLVLAFGNANFYVCFRLGPLSSQLKNKTKHDQEVIKNKFNETKSQSTVIAWSLFLSFILAMFLYVLIRRCCFMNAEGSLPTIHEYEKLEAEAAVATFHERMKELAQKEGKEQVELQLQGCREGESTYEVVKKTMKWLAAKYPRTTGDLTKDFRVDDVEADGYRPNANNEFVFVREESL